MISGHDDRHASQLEKVELTANIRSHCVRCSGNDGFHSNEIRRHAASWTNAKYRGSVIAGLPSILSVFRLA